MKIHLKIVVPIHQLVLKWSEPRQLLASNTTKRSDTTSLGNVVKTKTKVLTLGAAKTPLFVTWGRTRKSP